MLSGRQSLAGVREVILSVVLFWGLMLSRSLLRVVVVLTACGLLAACGADGSGRHGSSPAAATALPSPTPSTIDYATWRQEAAALGFSEPDLPGLERFTAGLCDDSDYELEALIAQAVDSSAQESIALMRVNFNHVCPDQLDWFDARRASVDESSANAQLACDTPASRRTEQQSLLAEMSGC